MKRLALALALPALVVGSGCIVTSDHHAEGSLDVAWWFIRTKANGTPTTNSYSCAQAGVDSVGLSFSSGPSTTVPCTAGGFDGAVITAIPAGSQTVTITGYRGSIALYSTQFTVNIPGAGTDVLDANVYGLFDDLDVNALFRTWNGAPGWGTCAAAGVSGLTYSIVDYAGYVIASGSVSCTDPAGVSFTGNQGLDRDIYTIRMQGFPSAGPETFDSATTAVTPTCDGQAFSHYGTDTGAAGWYVYLYDVTGNATLCP